MKNFKKGFTLIEILVAVSISGVLSSVVLAALSSGKAEAKDAKKMLEVKSVDTAIKLFHSNTGTVPDNNFTSSASGLPMPACEENEEGAFLTKMVYAMVGSMTSGVAYTNSMNQLVEAGVIPQIPRSEDGNSYCYFNYGGADGEGAVFYAKLHDNKVFSGVSQSALPSVTINSGEMHYFRLPAAGMNLEDISFRQTDGFVSGTSATGDRGYWTHVGTGGSPVQSYYVYDGSQWLRTTQPSTPLLDTEFFWVYKRSGSMTWTPPAGTVYYGKDSSALSNYETDFNAAYP